MGAVALCTALSCSPEIRGDRDTIFQVSAFSALMQGVYDGEITVGQLKHYGDTGIGTFQDLDGEMIVIDGNVYRACVDGSLETVSNDTTVPFATVTFLDNDKVVSLNEVNDIEGLRSYLDGLLPTENMFYAFRIDGKFSYIKTRSIPVQQKPFPTLLEAVNRGQQIREFNDVEGSIVGFRCPPYVEGVNVPGYHLHFIDKERTSGGHLLDCRISAVTVIVDSTANMIMQLPDNDAFGGVDLSEGDPQGVKQVEQGK